MGHGPPPGAKKNAFCLPGFSLRSTVVTRKTHIQIHDEFGFPTETPRRQVRRHGAVVVAILACGLAAVNVVSAFQNLESSGLQVVLIFTAITLGIFAACSPLLRSSRSALGLAWTSLVVVAVQFLMMYSIFKPAPIRPAATTASPQPLYDSPDSGAKIIDVLEKAKILSEMEAAHLRKGREEKQTLRYGPPPTNPLTPYPK